MSIRFLPILIAFLLGCLPFVASASPVQSPPQDEGIQRHQPAKRGFLTKILHRIVKRKASDPAQKPSRGARIVLSLGVAAILAALLPLWAPPILAGALLYTGFTISSILGLVAIGKRRRLRRSGEEQNQVSRRFINVGFILAAVSALPALLILVLVAAVVAGLGFI